MKKKTLDWFALNVRFWNQNIVQYTENQLMQFTLKMKHSAHIFYNSPCLPLFLNYKQQPKTFWFYSIMPIIWIDLIEFLCLNVWKWSRQTVWMRLFVRKKRDCSKHMVRMSKWITMDGTVPKCSVLLWLMQPWQ